jgi:hypothetical protein
MDSKVYCKVLSRQDRTGSDYRPPTHDRLNRLNTHYYLLFNAYLRCEERVLSNLHRVIRAHHASLVESLVGDYKRCCEYGNRGVSIDDQKLLISCIFSSLSYTDKNRVTDFIIAEFEAVTKNVVIDISCEGVASARDILVEIVGTLYHKLSLKMDNEKRRTNFQSLNSIFKYINSNKSVLSNNPVQVNHSLLVTCVYSRSLTHSLVHSLTYLLTYLLIHLIGFSQAI